MEDEYDTELILEEVGSAVLRQLWRQSGHHHDGEGLDEKGPDLTAAVRLHRSPEAARLLRGSGYG